MPIDQAELAKTLKRIKTSLNKRYEKDAELYISYQDTLVIKKHLYNKEYEAINDIVRNNIHSPAIVSRVIAKNLWLIHSTDITAVEENLKSIMNCCDWRFLKRIKEQIDDNKIEASVEVKQFILKTYYSIAPVEECINYLDNAEHFENDTIKSCFKKIVKKAETVADKMQYIEKYSKKYKFIENDKNILIQVIKQMSDEEQEKFQDEISNVVDEAIKKSSEPQIIYMYTLFYLDKALSILLEIGDNLDRYGYIAKWNVLCRVIKKYFKSIVDKEKMVILASQLSKDYVERPDGVKNCFMNQIFSKAGEFGKMKDSFIEGLKKNLDEKEMECIEVNKPTAKITNGKELFDFIEANPYTGPRWYEFILYHIFQLKKKEGSCLVEMLDKYINDNLPIESQGQYVEIFREYANRIRKNDNGISEVMQYFYDRHNVTYESAEEWLYSPNKSCVILDYIEQALVETIVERNFKQGGKNGIIYKFLFDFHKDKCMKLFDV